MVGDSQVGNYYLTTLSHSLALVYRFLYSSAQQMNRAFVLSTCAQWNCSPEFDLTSSIRPVLVPVNRSWTAVLAGCVMKTAVVFSIFVGSVVTQFVRY